MPGLSVLTIDTSQMLVAMAVGHQLAQHPELAVPDVLDQPFPGGSNLDPEWLRFWTLDEHRGGPPAFTDHRVETGEKALQVVASGRAIATIPATIANGRPHPGVASIPLSDGRRPRLASSGVTTTRTTAPRPGRSRRGLDLRSPERTRSPDLAPPDPEPRNALARHPRGVIGPAAGPGFPLRRAGMRVTGELDGGDPGRCGDCRRSGSWPCWRSAEALAATRRRRTAGAEARGRAGPSATYGSWPRPIPAERGTRRRARWPRHCARARSSTKASRSTTCRRRAARSASPSSSPSEPASPTS